MPRSGRCGRPAGLRVYALGRAPDRDVSVSDELVAAGDDGRARWRVLWEWPALSCGQELSGPVGARKRPGHPGRRRCRVVSDRALTPSTPTAESVPPDGHGLVPAQGRGGQAVSLFVPAPAAEGAARHRSRPARGGRSARRLARPRQAQLGSQLGICFRAVRARPLVYKAPGQRLDRFRLRSATFTVVPAARARSGHAAAQHRHTPSLVGGNGRGGG